MCSDAICPKKAIKKGLYLTQGVVLFWYLEVEHYYQNKEKIATASPMTGRE